jgi:hypothetical protein
MVEVAIPPGAVMADAIVPVVPVADVPATAVVPVVGGCRKPEMLTMAESSPATSSGVPA